MSGTNNENDESVEEYTRRRINVQLGDGPDQRGDVTVEMQREAGAEDQTFSNWHEETERAVKTLREQLSLE